MHTYIPIYYRYVTHYMYKKSERDIRFMYVCANLFQSSSVLDYICSPPKPSDPADSCNHYCKTLHCPILRFAMYLYCKVQLALLHHLQRGSFAANGARKPAMLLAQLASNRFIVAGNWWQSMKAASTCILMHLYSAQGNHIAKYKQNVTRYTRCIYMYIDA